MTLARIGGVPVRLHASWVLIAVAVVWSLWSTLDLGDASPGVVLVAAVVGALGFFGSILAHELGHAIAARRRGHAVHAVTLFVFGGVTGIDHDSRRWQDEFAIAAIGPWVSLNLAAVLGLVTAALDWYQVLGSVAAVTGMLGWLNLGLALFNLVPGAPLDGGRVVRALLWPLLGDRRRAGRVAAMSGIVVGLGLWVAAGYLALAADDALLSALWLTLVAAFIVAIAWGQWRAAAPTGHRGDPDTTTGPAEPPSVAAVRRRPPVRRWARSVLSVALVLAGLLVVPMPLIEESPGPAFDVGNTIDLSGEITPLEGELVMLTVFVRQPGLAEVLRARLSEHRNLRPIGEVIGPDRGTREYFSDQSELFATAFEQAAAAGLAAADEDVVVVHDVVVANVLPDGPSAGILQAGDVLETVDGDEVGSPESLAAETATLDPGSRLALRVRRDGEPVELEVEVGLLPGGQRTGIGIMVGTQLGQLELSRDVDQNDLRIGGPSAGLVTALTIYDLVAEEDLLAGRTVAATGTIGVDGAVGTIGGVREKIESAVAAEAELLVVPLAQASAFEAASAGRVPVVGVTSLDDAINALRGT